MGGFGRRKVVGSGGSVGVLRGRGHILLVGLGFDSARNCSGHCEWILALTPFAVLPVYQFLHQLIGFQLLLVVVVILVEPLEWLFGDLDLLEERDVA